MIAAIYARKSTEQHGVAEEQRSVTRQMDHARAYAARKGWTVADACVFRDDGISGAEFAARPGFLRLMNSLKPRAPFQVLIMSEESRLGREAIETAYALKQIVQAGVRVFFYLEDRERTLDSPTDKIMLSLTAFADELEREKARQRTYDAMARKARAGHVTGGRVFGYDNVEIQTPDGRRSHVERRINEGEAAVVRRIFELCAMGTGYTRIAKLLNAEGAPAPRPQQRRPAGWSPTSVFEVLRRPLYRGQIVWNQTRKRDRWGRKAATARAEGEWVTIDAPELRIVPEPLWHAARARLQGIRAQLEASHGAPLGRRSRDVDSVHLLVGFARCATCGASFYPLSRSHGQARAFFYGCSANHKRGQAVCGNAFVMREERIHVAVLQALAQAIVGDTLRPAVVEAVLEGVWAELAPAARGATVERVRADLATVDREIANLAEAIACGGQLGPLLDTLRARQARQASLQEALSAASTAAPTMDRRAVERHVRARLARWQGLLASSVVDGRQFFREALHGPIRFTARPEAREYCFEGEIALGPLFSGVAALAPFLASPTGFDQLCTRRSSGRVRAA